MTRDLHTLTQRQELTFPSLIHDYTRKPVKRRSPTNLYAHTHSTTYILTDTSLIQKQRLMCELFKHKGREKRDSSWTETSTVEDRSWRTSFRVPAAHKRTYEHTDTAEDTRPHVHLPRTQRKARVSPTPRRLAWLQ